MTALAIIGIALFGFIVGLVRPAPTPEPERLPPLPDEPPPPRGWGFDEDR